MIQGLDVFMSKHDLESGTRWSDALARQLEGSNFGILCLTPENLTKPWLLYEAGALTKQLGGRACGVLLDAMSPTQDSGPLAQFQNRQFNETEIKQLVKDINISLEPSLEDDQIDLIFSKWWPDLQRDYQAAMKIPVDTQVAPKRNEQDVLEEILVRMRTLERRFTDDNDFQDLRQSCENGKAADTACVRGSAANFNRFVCKLKRTAGLENCVPQIVEKNHYHIVNFNSCSLKDNTVELQRLAADCDVRIEWIM